LEDIEMNKKTTWWIVLVLVGVTMAMAGGIRAAAMIEASQAQDEIFAVLSGRFCGRVCLEAEEEAIDPLPEPPPPPPPMISDRLCDRMCLEVPDPIPEPPPPPILS
jgi:hypothetical protein